MRRSCARWVTGFSLLWMRFHEEGRSIRNYSDERQRNIRLEYNRQSNATRYYRPMGHTTKTSSDVDMPDASPGYSGEIWEMPNLPYELGFPVGGKT